MIDMSKLKVGDKVRLIDDCPYADVKCGGIGVVTNVYNTNFKGRTETKFSVNNVTGCAPEYWELVEPAPFQVSDFPAFVAAKYPTTLSNREKQNMSLMGLAGETGELIDAFKKHYYYDKPLDADNVKEEIGDIFHYLTALMQTVNLTLEEIIQANVDKLNKRYPNGFSKEAAIARADKEPGK